jgi:hypothetical protein
MPAMPAPMMRASSWVAFVELLANGTASVVADIFPPVQVDRHALRDMNTLVLLLTPAHPL